MRDVFTRHERFSFLCLKCDERWDDLYEVREWHVVDEDYLSYSRDGRPAMAPTNRLCRSCGSYRVRMLPTHTTQPEPPML